MANPRREQIKVLLDQALALPANERGAFLEKTCSSDVAMRRELESLLAHADEALGFFESLAGGVLPTISENTDSLVGEHISHYEVLSKLGGGGMGVVYKARDTKLGRTVALKFLTHLLSSDEEAKKRFVQEAKAASALDHANIGTIYEINEAGEGRMFIAMACYEGETLKAKIERGPLSIEEARDFTIQIAKGLSKAHAAGIVHRDIKPANIMVTQDGVVKIVDFGLAKMTGADQLTKTGTTLGTVAYMSPEQIQGEVVDHRTDLWSMGVMLYEMLTGQKPFTGAYEAAMLYDIVHTEPESIETHRANVPAVLAEVAKKLLEKDAALRPQGAEDILPLLTLPESTIKEVGQIKHNTPGRFFLPALVIILIAAFSIFLLKPGTGKITEASEGNPTDIKKVAILPFDVRAGDDLANLREDMVEVLHLAIQSSEEVTSVDPNALMVYTDDDARASNDPVRGDEIARHFNAGWYVLGRVSRLGEQLRITPRLYRQGGESIDIEPIVMTNELNIQSATDTLAQHIIGAVLNRPGLRIASIASRTTDSPIAFRHFMRGQKFFREQKFDDASEAFESALEIDSTFALAALQQGITHFYIDPDNVNDQHRFYLQAERHIERLPVASKWLVQARINQTAHGKPDEAEQLYKKYLERYPDDGYALISLGDLLFHYNPMRGRSAREAIEYLERGYQIVRSDQDDALLHLGIFAIQDNADERYLWVEMQKDSISGKSSSSVIRSPIYSRMILKEPEERGPYIDSLAELNLPMLTLNLYLNVRDLRNAIRSNEYDSEPGRTHFSMLFEAASGRFKTADSIRFDRDSDQYALSLFHRARAAASPWSSFSPEEINEIREEVSRWDHGNSVFHRTSVVSYKNPEDVKNYLLGILSFRLRDDSTLTALIEQATSRPATGNEDGFEIAVSNILRGLHAALDGDTETTIQRFRSARVPLPSFWYTFSSPLSTQGYSRLIIAELLFNEGRYEEALPWNSSVFSGWDTDGVIYAAPIYYRRAQIYEELGNTEDAITYYDRFLDFWEDADPELQPMVQDAQERLNVLLSAMTVEK